ncbi:hypothetical protein ACIP6P_20325 [Streptomyces sp. NPDC088729]|uniref:hypothetical protein n=1 Tax=unclassified Streptomyces TaxID=2593676 RepID=UPI0013DE62F6|nr:hypothetical protein [Streptomyces sp. ADI96-02]
MVITVARRKRTGRSGEKVFGPVVGVAAADGDGDAAMAGDATAVAPIAATPAITLRRPAPEPGSAAPADLIMAFSLPALLVIEKGKPGG